MRNTSYKVDASLNVFNLRTQEWDAIALHGPIDWCDYIPQTEVARRVFDLSQEVLGLSPMLAALRTMRLSIGLEPTP